MGRLLFLSFVDPKGQAQSDGESPPLYLGHLLVLEIRASVAVAFLLLAAAGYKPLDHFLPETVTKKCGGQNLRGIDYLRNFRQEKGSFPREYI